VEQRSLPARQLARRGSGEQAAVYIRKLVFDGYLKPGDRVHQDDVAKALGISRIPVREALVALEQQGWVTVETNRGAFVTSLDERAVHDHYELYGIIYGFAAKKALERSDSALGEKLTQLAADFARATEPREAQAVAIEFHYAVTDAAASPRIEAILRGLSAMVPGRFYERVPEAITRQRTGFAEIADACARDDGDRAAIAYASMMRDVGNEVVRLFRNKGLFVSRATSPGTRPSTTPRRAALRESSPG
jgi:DNA-binding GntR family transcriptional regulator